MIEYYLHDKILNISLRWNNNWIRKCFAVGRCCYSGAVNKIFWWTLLPDSLAEVSSVPCLPHQSLLLKVCSPNWRTLQWWQDTVWVLVTMTIIFNSDDGYAISSCRRNADFMVFIFYFMLAGHTVALKDNSHPLFIIIFSTRCS